MGVVLRAQRPGGRTHLASCTYVSPKRPPSRPTRQRVVRDPPRLAAQRWLGPALGISPPVLGSNRACHRGCLCRSSPRRNTMMRLLTGAALLSLADDAAAKCVTYDGADYTDTTLSVTADTLDDQTLCIYHDEAPVTCTEVSCTAVVTCTDAGATATCALVPAVEVTEGAYTWVITGTESGTGTGTNTGVTCTSTLTAATILAQQKAACATQADGSVQWIVDPAPENSVVAQLTLDIEMPAEAELDAFKGSFSADVAATLDGVSADDVLITSVTSGSVVVDFYIAPAADGTVLVSADAMTTALAADVSIAGATLTADSVTSAPTVAPAPDGDEDEEPLPKSSRASAIGVSAVAVLIVAAVL